MRGQPLNLKVGDKVVVRDINERHGGRGGLLEATVTKVGRKLVTVETGLYHNRMVFRLETGVANDGYGHSWIETPEEYEEGIRRGELVTRLRELGVEFRFGVGSSSLPLSKLERLVAVMEEGE